MPILLVILFVIIYIPLGVIFELMKGYSGGGKKKSHRRRRR